MLAQRLLAEGGAKLMANRTPGWYPDPNDNSTEHYWDGAGWHGKRKVRPLSSPEGFDQKNENALSRYWNSLDSRSKVGAVIGAVATSFVLLGLVMTVVEESSNSELRDSCEAEASRNGYSGAEFDQVVEFCIDYDEQFGGQP
ncbi:DUF2510 domain-containing protein [Mycolicibacterium arabiense]